MLYNFYKTWQQAPAANRQVAITEPAHA